MEKQTIVLLGKTGVGKSTTANTILGRNAFKARSCVDSVTKECQAEEAVIGDKHVRVVDTPGFFDSEMPEKKLAEQLAKSVNLARKGVHAFILLFKYDRFTEQEVEIITRMKKVFGEKVTKHMIVVFTHGDEAGNDGGNICSNQNITKVLDQCGGRYQIFNNKNPNNTQQVSELLKTVDTVVRQNSGRCYTSVAYEEANRSTWENFWETFRPVFYKVVSQLNEAAKVSDLRSVKYPQYMISMMVLLFFIKWREVPAVPDSVQGTLALGFQLLITKK